MGRGNWYNTRIVSESKPKPESKFTPFSPGTLDSGGDEGKKEPVVDQSEAPVEQVEPAEPDQQETLALTESSAPAESTELDQSKLPAAPEALAKNEVMTEVGQLIDDAGDLISLLKTLKSNIDTLDSNQVNPFHGREVIMKFPKLATLPREIGRYRLKQPLLIKL